MMHKITTTHLEMLSKNQFVPSKGFESEIMVKKIQSGDGFMNFSFFIGVGLPWAWYSRLKWSYESWLNYFKQDSINTYLAFHKNSLIGYYELEIAETMDIEIKFFGLLPFYIGKGLGAQLLSHCINSAWESGARRVWVHTCDFDHAYALNNYLNRGFSIYNQVTEDEDIPDKHELLNMVQEYLLNYINNYSTGLTRAIDTKH